MNKQNVVQAVYSFLEMLEIQIWGALEYLHRLYLLGIPNLKNLKSRMSLNPKFIECSLKVLNFKTFLTLEFQVMDVLPRYINEVENQSSIERNDVLTHALTEMNLKAPC